MGHNNKKDDSPLNELENTKTNSVNSHDLHNHHHTNETRNEHHLHDDHDHHHNHDHDHHHKKNRFGIIGKFFSTIFHTHDHKPSMEINFDEQTEIGMKAVKLSFFGLMITAILQVYVVIITNSMALFADTIHNFSDALTSVPLFFAYRLVRRKKSKKFTYGYGKIEELAGLFILLMIAWSAYLIVKESIIRFFNPVPIENIGVLIAASIIGFIGNELVASYRIRIGKQINSNALIADGYHSRIDGFISLSVLIGAIGAIFGLYILDTLVGLVIGVIIIIILKDSSRMILIRLIDGVEPEIIDKIHNLTSSNNEVQSVHNVKARWSGRQLNAELHVVVNREYSLERTHSILHQIEEDLKQNIRDLEIIIHADPCDH